MRPRAVVAAVLLTFGWTSLAEAGEDLLITDAEADCVAESIFINECSGKESNLIYWSADEPFPSLGIGHFIWYPEGASGPYLESFPGFLDFAQETGVTLPTWLSDRETSGAPWTTREQFQKDLSSDPRMKELRDLLSRTKREQAHYILRRFNRVFPKILEETDVADQEDVRAKYELLMRTPKGRFAMVDYVNFKGEGYRDDARYDGVGWGLAQVLAEMEYPDDPSQALEMFIAACIRVLERRVAHAPRTEVESGWLRGWRNRLQRYKEISC